MNYSELPPNVKVGKGCVINQGCQFLAEVGEIVIGDYTVFEEGCFIRNNQLKRMTIGSYNVFEISCRVDNSNIGDCNHIQTKTIIESGCQIGNNCIFGTSSKIPQKQTIQDFTRIYYPYNVIRMDPFDMTSHKEEIAELCVSLLLIHDKQQQKNKN